MKSQMIVTIIAVAVPAGMLITAERQLVKMSSQSVRRSIVVVAAINKQLLRPTFVGMEIFHLISNVRT